MACCATTSNVPKMPALPSPRQGVNDVDLQALRAGQPAGLQNVSLQGLQPARWRTDANTVEIGDCAEGLALHYATA